MEVNPTRPSPDNKTEHWVPRELAPTIQWTGRTGLAWIQATETRTTEFTAQKEGLKNRTTQAAAELGRNIPLFGTSSGLNGHSIEAY